MNEPARLPIRPTRCARQNAMDLRPLGLVVRTPAVPMRGLLAALDMAQPAHQRIQHRLARHSLRCGMASTASSSGSAQPVRTLGHSSSGVVSERAFSPAVRAASSQSRTNFSRSSCRRIRLGGGLGVVVDAVELALVVGSRPPSSRCPCLPSTSSMYSHRSASTRPTVVVSQ